MNKSISLSKFSQIGKLAPNFITVAVYKGKIGKVRLSDYRGKKYVILLFYPANFTRLANQELILVNRFSKKFKKFSTQLLAISTDSPFCHLNFVTNAEKQRLIAFLDYPLVSDLTHQIINDYCVLSKHGISFPSLFIIDKQGVIQYYSVNNLLCIRNINEILRILRSIQIITENPIKVKFSRRRRY